MLRFFLLLLICWSESAAPHAQQFEPQNYQTDEGALLLQNAGNYIEPYFATKALLMAEDAGLDIRQSGLAWIRWGLAHQNSQGLFERYCQKTDGTWHECGAADADDSMLALWLQLLYRMAPGSGLPSQWRSSAGKAESRLSHLRNRRLGLYHVSSLNHAALLMDNVEVYSALRDIASAKSRFGDEKGARQTAKDADNLASAIQHVFWNQHAQWYRPSMQKTPPRFYPDVVAQVYPWLAGLSAPGQDVQVLWTRWKSRFAPAWLESSYDPHPWGLVALAALKTGDKSSVICWLTHSQSLRYSSRWNVLEEAVYQGLEQRFSHGQPVDATACTQVEGR
jgi:hypothetical protein